MLLDAGWNHHSNWSSYREEVNCIALYVYLRLPTYDDCLLFFFLYRCDLVKKRITASTKVVQLKRKGGIVIQDCEIYIGRRVNMGGWNLPESKWHNPFKRASDAPQDKLAAIAQYEQYVRSRPDLMRSLPELEGKILGCWCKSHSDIPCHGDVLVKLLAEQRVTLRRD
jgi:hypothetical protein